MGLRLSAVAGARAAEVVALQWADLTGDRLAIGRQRHSIEGEALVRDRTKTGKSRVVWRLVGNGHRGGLNGTIGRSQDHLGRVRTEHVDLLRSWASRNPVLPEISPQGLDRSLCLRPSHPTQGTKRSVATVVRARSSYVEQIANCVDPVPIAEP